MIHKTSLIIFFLIFQSFVFSQNKIFVATYSIKVIENSKLKNAPENIKNIYYGENRIAENLQPKLFFNDSISEFRLDENVIGGKLAKLIFCNCLKTIYTNNDKRITFYNSYTLRMMEEIYAKEDDYCVIDSLDTKWDLTSEHKFIQNYKVYKAIKNVKKTTDNQQISVKTIVAWYCPEVPYSFGPKGYGGLPGLIFELQDEDSVLGLTSLKEIPKFEFTYLKSWNTGKKITRTDLETIIESKHSAMKPK